MGGLVSGIFDLVGGDPTQSEEQGLQSLSSFENPAGEKGINAAQGYYGGILSGDPAEISKTLAPEIKAGQDQVNQQAQTNAQFGNRSGGTNASTQAAQSNERGNIINLIGGLQQGAAAAEAGLGENLLSQGANNLNSQADLALKNRQRQVGDVSGIASDVASIAAPFLAPAAAATGGASDLVGTLNPAFAATQAGPEPASFGGDFLSGLEETNPGTSTFNF